MDWWLTQGKLKADGPVSDLPVNHGGFKQRPKQQKSLLVVFIQLGTETSTHFHPSVCQIDFTFHNVRRFHELMTIFTHCSPHLACAIIRLGKVKASTLPQCIIALSDRIVILANVIFNISKTVTTLGFVSQSGTKHCNNNF